MTDTYVMCFTWNDYYIKDRYLHNNQTLEAAVIKILLGFKIFLEKNTCFFFRRLYLFQFHKYVWGTSHQTIIWKFGSSDLVKFDTNGNNRTYPNNQKYSTKKAQGIEFSSRFDARVYKWIRICNILLQWGFSCTCGVSRSWPERIHQWITIK